MSDKPYPTVLELERRIAALEACEEARKSPLGEPSQEMQERIRQEINAMPQPVADNAAVTAALKWLDTIDEEDDDYISLINLRWYIVTIKAQLAEAIKSDAPALEIAERQRDQALADLAAARESERRLRAEIEAAFRKHGLAAGPTAVDRLVEEIAALRAQVERKRAEVIAVEDRLFAREAERDTARAELAAERERREKAETALRDAPKFHQIPDSGMILRRCEACGRLDELPAQLSQVGLASCQCCALRAELAAEREKREQAESARAIHFQMRERAIARCAVLEGLLASLRMSLADRVPPDCNERFSMVNRIDAALAGKDGGK